MEAQFIDSNDILNDELNLAQNKDVTSKLEKGGK